MEFKGTVERLMSLQALRNENEDIYTCRKALDRLIDAQVDRVKVNVMTHILDGMDFFNGKE